MTILTRDAGVGPQEWLEQAHEAGAALLVDKDLNWTSFDVVARLRSLLRIKKIGHAGTLDPLATGLLIICCGKATKSIDGFQAQEKEYLATLRLGATTATFDAEMEEENVRDVSTLSQHDIETVVSGFVGDIEQIPPMYSARKVGGKRLYDLARKGTEVEREARQVHVACIDILGVELPLVSVRIQCSKGTYIRSLAHDIGERLGCGAYLKSLRRSAIGEYRVDTALRMSELEALFRPSSSNGTPNASAQMSATALDPTDEQVKTAAEGSNG